MSTPKALDVKVFVPAKDFQLSLQFYTTLGWQLNWEHDGGLAELELGDSRFFLQNYYAKDWAENFMLYIPVADVQAWFEHISQILTQYDFPGTRVSPPKLESHGARVCYVWDPCGVLLHFAQLVEG